MSTTTESGFNLEAIGSWGETSEFKVEREKIQAYAESTNDPIEVHQKGDIAPPVFAVVPAFEALSTMSVSVIPPEMLMRVLHGEQDFRYHKPIEPGMTLKTRAQVAGIHGRSSGVTVCCLGETRDAATDELLVEQYMTSFVRGAELEGGAGTEPPSHGLDPALLEKDADATVSQTFDKDQTFRYSEAAGDPMPIHLDDEVAKAMGLPGIIIHGLCTLAFNSWAVIGHACPDDPTQLKRLAVRFSKVVLPEETIDTRIWSTGEQDGKSVYAFQTDAENGDPVIKDGLAEVAS
jgi:acyl dehydratase